LTRYNISSKYNLEFFINRYFSVVILSNSYNNNDGDISLDDTYN